MDTNTSARDYTERTQYVVAVRDLLTEAGLDYAAPQWEDSLTGEPIAFALIAGRKVSPSPERGVLVIDGVPHYSAHWCGPDRRRSVR